LIIEIVPKERETYSNWPKLNLTFLCYVKITDNDITFIGVHFGNAFQECKPVLSLVHSSSFTISCFRVIPSSATSVVCPLLLFCTQRIEYVVVSTWMALNKQFYLWNIKLLVQKTHILP